jgi:hypothetical protein
VCCLPAVLISVTALMTYQRLPKEIREDVDTSPTQA